VRVRDGPVGSAVLCKDIVGDYDTVLGEQLAFQDYIIVVHRVGFICVEENYVEWTMQNRKTGVSHVSGWKYVSRASPSTILMWDDFSAFMIASVARAIIRGSFSRVTTYC
jgi:hypothetical protein